MLLDGLLVGLLIGWLRGGRLKRLGEQRWRGLELVVGAFVFQLFIPQIGRALGLGWRARFALLVASYLVLFVAVFLNRDRLDFRIIGVGILLNFVVIVANGGMPVSLPMVERFTPVDLRYVVEHQSVLHIAMTTATKLRLLGDIVPFPVLLWRPKWMVVSVGDIILSAGVIWLVQAGMTSGAGAGAGAVAGTQPSSSEGVSPSV